MTSLERKTRVDDYVNVKIINDAISVIPCMTEESLKCAERIHNQNISNNQILDKEEAGAYKSEHQTSLLSLISSTTVNGGRPKGSTLKNKKTSKR